MDDIWGMRERQIRIVSSRSVTKSRRLPDSVSVDQLPALRKSCVWFTINLSGETQKSLVPCGRTMTRCNPAGVPGAASLFQELSSFQLLVKLVLQWAAIDSPSDKTLWLLSSAAHTHIDTHTCGKTTLYASGELRMN